MSLTSGLLLLSDSEIVVENAGRLRYDSTLKLVETRLTAEYAITSWLAVGGSLPYRVVDVGVNYFDAASGVRVQNGSSIHIRDETLNGWGDPQLALHGAYEIAGWRLHARVGATFPVGNTVENPHALGAIGQEHEHIQLGAGSIIPMLGIEAQRAVGPVTLAAFGVTYISVSENDKGYKPGTRISGGIAGSYPVLRQLTVGAAAEVHGETAEKWDGQVYSDEGNDGRTDVLAGLSVAYRPLDQLAIIADAKVPVYSHIDGTQVDYGPVFGLGVVGTFDTRKRASYGHADVADLGPAGSAAPLTPVAGKLTVFDLWASWCAPCRELDDRLAELARNNPDRLAVRRLEVVDNDSAAWTTYLAPGHYDLPHVRVVDESGKIVLEKTAPPAELVAAITTLLHPAPTSQLTCPSPVGDRALYTLATSDEIAAPQTCTRSDADEAFIRVTAHGSRPFSIMPPGKATGCTTPDAQCDSVDLTAFLISVGAKLEARGIGPVSTMGMGRCWENGATEWNDRHLSITIYDWKYANDAVTVLDEELHAWNVNGSYEVDVEHMSCGTAL
jgi:thiol-disulfide isomerase/thioredoxin